MATTINNTTVNVRFTIIFDSAGSLTGDGPAKGTGNTESDIYLDDKVYHNIRSHTEIASNIHALQWDATTNTGEIEYTTSIDNLSISSIPQWATNVVIRCEAHDAYTSAYNSHADANAEDDSAAVTAATTARDNYLTAHSITF